MKAFKLIAQHYDMKPGDIVYSVSSLGEGVFTVNEFEPREPYLRLVPQEKIEEINVMD